MLSIGIGEAKKRWSEVLRKVASGNEIAITRRGKIVARLVPVDTVYIERSTDAARLSNTGTA